LAVGDIRDRVALEAATAGVEVVYHLAAIYRQAGVKREVYQAVNAAAVRDIVELPPAPECGAWSTAAP
jgi:nucleoside-diphosphate-sugar epimerase